MKVPSTLTIFLQMFLASVCEQGTNIILISRYFKGPANKQTPLKFALQITEQMVRVKDASPD